MTDANPYRNAAQDPDFLARNAKDQQQASPEAIARYRASFERETDQYQINRAIAAYEASLKSYALEIEDRFLEERNEARMAPKPKPKFILHIDGNHFHARPSRATLWDVLFVAIATATWLALLTSIYLVFK